MNRRLISALLAFPLAASLAAVVRADDSGDVIMARAHPDVVLIWKTNDAIDGPGSARFSKADLYAALLARAEKVMAAHAGGSASNITVRLVYFHNGSDPRYKIATLSGVDTIGTVSASIADLRKHDTSWHAALLARRIPTGLHVDVPRDKVVRATP